MESAKKKRVFQRKFTAPIRLFLIKRRLVCDADFSPDVLSLCRSVQGGRFSKDDKTWNFPPGSYEDLKRGCFSRKIQFISCFKESDIQIILSAKKPDIEKAEKELAANPFQVSDEILALASPVVVISRAEKSPSVRIVTPHKSNAVKIISLFDSAHLIPREGLFWFPAHEIPELVKKFRDENISFGVSFELGKELSSTAKLRQAIVKEGYLPNRYELEDALLSPHIDYNPEEDERPFVLNWFTREQLTSAFPEKRNARTYTATESELSRFLILKESLPFKVWFTKEAHDRLLKNGGQTKNLSLFLGQDDSVCLAVGNSDLTGFGQLISKEGEIWSVKDSNLLELRKLLDQSGKSIEISEPVIDRIKELEEGEKLRTITKDLKTQSDLSPELIADLNLETAKKLYPHQRIGVKFLLDFPEAFLGDDMGLGKTLTVLSSFASLFTQKKVDCLLVFCPASLLGNWQREAANWFPQFKVALLSGTKAEKNWLIRLMNKSLIDFQIVLVNYEAARLEYVQEGIENLCSTRDVFLCCDESQRVKNPQGKTFKALKSISTKASRRVLLSGTPTPRNISDLWSQMFLLDSGKRFGKSYFKWLSRIAELGNRFSQYAVKKFKPDQVNDSLLRLDEILLRRQKEEVISLPEKTFVERFVELTGDQLDRYEEVREALLLRTTTLSGKEFTREISTLLEEYLRAVQMASNPRLIDPSWKGEPAKFLELDQLVEELVVNNGKKVVIWTNYLLNVSELTKRYKDHGAVAFTGEVDPKTRTEIVSKFQNEEKPKILVAIPAAGGVGITLTAADTAIYLDKTWNGEHWMQSIDRVHRIGQKGTVTIISLFSSKVDQLIHRNVEQKRKFQAQVFSSDRTIQPEQLTLEDLLSTVNVTEDIKDV